MENTERRSNVVGVGKGKQGRLYVGNIPYTMTEERLIQIFSEFGFAVSNPHIVIDRETGRSKGFAFVEAGEHAQAAITAMDGSNIDGRNFRVSHAISKPQSGRTTDGR